MDLGKQRGWLLPSDFELVDREFIELVSRELEVPVDRAKQYVDLLMPEISLEELLDIYEVSELEYDTHLVHDGQAETIQYVQTKELHHILELVLSTLTKRESDVIRLRFGFVDGRPRTLEEIGKEFDITRERIRQIESKALRKLRHPSRAKYLRCFC